MEYIYAAMLLHATGKKVDEASVTKVLEAASAKVDDMRVKALCATLEGVDIDAAIKQATITQAVASAPAQVATAEKKDDKKEEKKVEEAAAGLGALFG